MDKSEATNAALASILDGASVETAAREHGTSASAIYYRARLDAEYGRKLYGRPSQKSRQQARQDRYLDALRGGASLREASRLSEVNLSTARYWRLFDADYRARFERARVDGLQASAAAAAAALGDAE